VQVKQQKCLSQKHHKHTNTKQNKTIRPQKGNTKKAIIHKSKSSSKVKKISTGTISTFIISLEITTGWRRTCS
jgi:hypothetical protein